MKINGKYEVSKGLELGIKKFLHTGVVNVFDDEGDKAEKVCHCPVCGAWHNRHYRAVDCCLWREVDLALWGHQEAYSAWRPMAWGCR